MKISSLIFILSLWGMSLGATEASGCLSSASHIIVKKSDLKFKVVNLSELEIMSKLGQGTSVNVYGVKYGGDEFVFRELLVSSKKGHDILELLDKNEKDELKKMDYSEAKLWMGYYQKIFQESLDRNFTLIERYHYDMSKVIFSFWYMKKIESLRYQDRRIVPQMIALVKNQEGMIVGQLIEYLPGVTLNEFMYLPVVTKEKFDMVLDQLLEILTILGKNNFTHGDLVSSNIMVKFLKDGKFEVKIIDFEPSLIDHSFDFETQKKMDLLRINGFKKDFKGISMNRLIF